MKLMTHVVVGYPTVKDTIEIIKTMASNGADMIELQIPFSDPLADGPTIMKACEQSLANGTKVKDSFSVATILSKEIKIPLLFMSYFNIVFKYGVEKFCRDAKNSGISGLIVPDMPIDEEQEEHFYALCQKYNLNNIQVVSPVSTDNRLKKNAKIARGFVYATSHQGITGAKDQLNPNFASYLKKLRNYFPIPIAVGFGISKKEHIQMLAPYADIAVVGSTIIDIISNSKKEDIKKNVANFLKDLII
ncbi:tryptophan synthase subunit alpha [Candidatus Roizmanbacteria bacterium]|nr:tryptophan synthase subunit alpha [Candidatus Roizmanbacteria bacterium]